MKNSILFSLLLMASGAWAQSTPSSRFEAEVGVSVLNYSSPFYRPGWHLRQQLTGYIRPRLGIALGMGWGTSATNNPLATVGPASGTYPQPDPTQLLSFYQRQDLMTDLSAVVLPVLTRRQQLKVQAGLSLYRHRELGVERVIREDPRDPYYLAVSRYTDTRRVVPMLALSYDYRLSSRWAVGLNATGYLAGAGQSATTMGLRTTYRFNMLADSLDIRPVPWSDLRAGLRLAGSWVGENGMGPGGRYRTRFVGGLWAELPLSLTWSVRGELNYAQRGYRSDEVKSGNSRYLANFANVNYLEMPLLFRHEVAERWHLYTGPYLAFFLNGYTETDGQRNAPVRPNTNTGMMVGASYKLTLSLAADARYQRDLVQISSRPYGGFHSFQLGLNWAFR